MVSEERLNVMEYASARIPLDAIDTDITDVVTLPITDFQRDVRCLFGIPVDVISVEAALSELRDASTRRIRCFFSTPNLNFLVNSYNDTHFRNSVICSDLSVADGMPLVWLGKLIGIKEIERVAGATLFERLVQETRNRLSVYFFGGGKDAGRLAAASINAKNVGVTCVGYMYPGFGSVEEMSRADTIEEINRCAPDFLIVALGAKKGQAWLQRNQNRLNAPVISHLGAVVNMAAGTIARAPVWMQKCGLEWAWRIKEEPSLWRRYLNDGLILGKLLVFRALPSYIYLKQRPQSDLFRTATVTVRQAPDTCFLHLTGPWERAILGPLRRAMSAATGSPCDIVITVGNVHYVDSAVLGLFLLLYGHQLKLGRTLRFEGVNAELKRIFNSNCVSYLMA